MSDLSPKADPTGANAGPEHEVTRLLAAWSRGSSEAAEQLTELVYAQVRAIAGKHLRQFDGDVTLAPTELANELFLRLLGKDIDWRDRRHFFGVIVAAMRNLLIDLARARGSENAAAAWYTSRCPRRRTSPAKAANPSNSSTPCLNCANSMRASAKSSN
ncbi:ECF-type sigma factor [Tahibacter amnicola]|uniref:ECF-type sigma factor n=1 Tax=Tahibacter amnicola TaxID=2976241 RepID=A0ABY6BFS4_9GAMM|nr:ECF-type sigma factor [Tahibacter amnicola]UXI66717.1 ECF-type sigma factor [Tahibacter amnicola]